MSVISELQAKNPGLNLVPITDASFAPYGKVLSGINGDKIMQTARSMWKVADGVQATVSVPEFEADKDLMKVLSERMFGGMPIEIGWVYGRNDTLNAQEYHHGSEVIFPLEDAVLLVSLASAIEWTPDPSLDTKHVKAFFLPKGTIVEMSSWCMHFAPINASKKAGFCNLFSLPRGTGTALDFKPDASPEGKVLACKNCWVLYHPESPDAAGKYAGLRGKNIKVNQLD